MYTTAVEAGFSAAHRLRLPDGTLEPLHGHNWTVRACFTLVDPDDVGTGLDPLQARSALRSVLAPLDHTNLNEVDALAELNPTAEVVARYIFERLRALGSSNICRVEVGEAPGCLAAFEPSGPHARGCRCRKPSAPRARCSPGTQIDDKHEGL